MLDLREPQAAMVHGISALCDLVEAQVGVISRIAHFSKRGAGEVRWAIDVGWSSQEQRDVAVRPYFTAGCRADPSAAAMMDDPQRRFESARRTDLVPDEQWYGCAFYREARAAANIDHLVHSIAPVPEPPSFFSSESRHSPGGQADVVSGLTMIRGRGDPDFTSIEVGLIDLFHKAAWPLWVRHRKRPVEERLLHFDLTRRELETARLLMAGEAPRDIADCLNISLHTCQQYIKSIYRKLQVRGRAEFMARFSADGSD